MTTANGTLPLSNSQVTILKTLARNPNGLSRDQLLKKSKVVVDNSTLGPVYEETFANHPESLTALRLVRTQKLSPDSPTTYTLTEKGEEAESKYSARKRGQTDKVDATALDTVVLAIRPLKPYGLELFTEEDLKEIREKLPKEYQAVTLPSLRQQIVNRRKRGAYSEAIAPFPHWYREYRDSQEFSIFASKVRGFYRGCVICSNEEASIYHRRFTNDNGDSILGMENANDGVMICGQCHNRNARFMCAIPEHEPDTESQVEMTEEN